MFQLTFPSCHCNILHLLAVTSSFEPFLLSPHPCFSFPIPSCLCSSLPHVWLHWYLIVQVLQATWSQLILIVSLVSWLYICPDKLNCMTHNNVIWHGSHVFVTYPIVSLFLSIPTCTMISTYFYFTLGLFISLFSMSVSLAVIAYIVTASILTHPYPTLQKFL